MNLLEKNIHQLREACSRHQVGELYAFGSVLTEKFGPKSDLDFVVDIDVADPIQYAENYFDLKFEMEQIFQRRIDLLEAKAIRNQAFKNSIDQKKILVYARRNTGMA